MTFRLYMGWDPLDTVAFEVCAASVKARASIDVEIIPLNQRSLRHRGLFNRPFWCDTDGQFYDLVDHKPCSTEFSFTRFLVPALEEFGSDWVGFCDADMLWRRDIAELVALIDPDKSLMCVKHNHRPDAGETKMMGLRQTSYHRKNWSSLYLIRPDRNTELTPYAVNNNEGSYLHGFRWLSDEQIGALPEEWNWLAGWSDPDINPAVVHFTHGTPDLPGHEEEPFAEEWRAELKGTGLNLAAFPVAV
jgi:hypothetical protein